MAGLELKSLATEGEAQKRSREACVRLPYLLRMLVVKLFWSAKEVFF
jgi:hypothetical protein